MTIINGTRGIVVINHHSQLFILKADRSQRQVVKQKDSQDNLMSSQVGGVKVPGTRQNHVPGQAITLKSDRIVPAGRESTHEISGVVVPGTYDFMLS